MMLHNTETLLEDGPFQLQVEYLAKPIAQPIADDDGYADPQEYETKLQSVTLWLENERIELLPKLSAAQEDLIISVLKYQ